MRLFLISASLITLATPALAADSKPQIGSFGFDTAGMDTSVKPGDDFVAYANGKYFANLQIPADKTAFGMSSGLSDLSRERTRSIIEKAAASNAAPGSEAQKVGDYFATYMDEAAIEAKGIAPIKPDLDAVAAIKDKAGYAALIGSYLRLGQGGPIQFGIGPDRKNPDRFVVQGGQGGLGLPDRDYYLDEKNPAFAAARVKYKAYVATMLGLAGYDNAAARADAIFALEMQLAKVHWSRVERRQAEKTYNPVPVGELGTRFPGFDWAAYFKASTIPVQGDVIISTPSSVEAIAKIIDGADLNVLKDYMVFQILRSASSGLPKAFGDATFDMYNKTLGGQPEQAPRWKRGVDFTSNALGEAIGKLYVAEYFPPAAKAKIDELVKNIIAALDARLDKLAWMDPKTRAAAREKLAAFTPKIGYPDKWRDYSKLTIVRGDMIGNARRLAEFEFNDDVEKLNKPVDRSEWFMTPMTVNAYANPTWNEIVFPAAILQAPFFDPNADDAVNYGAIGGVIGHEITHHFDDQGRKYDKTGRLAEWWTADDVARFKEGTDKVVAQYGAYEPLPGKKINGQLTLGENMADLAGVTIAYDAYQRSLKGKKAKVIDGFTGDQRFFLAFAQSWRTKNRDAALQQQLVTDPHTASHFRPYVVRNLDVWYKAFNVKPGEKLYLKPEERIKVW
ncbi:peptidase M13 [Sandarakinorhabdus cyanobacteriorum]|uniref:Peptidase M13 n=1 Tax=Sandarakinorhabdus cyanobacteriorum TaxID=1981098 RepID=A0A255Y7B6_9SPHN|nr:M13-type metalloendopeptidase [Sandarakinorhabdus cyanobacteriorum]OYQ24330.1 peptidase M13 [Sandarakinorhabdus cyanobacteriorum]